MSLWIVKKCEKDDWWQKRKSHDLFVGRLVRGPAEGGAERHQISGRSAELCSAEAVTSQRVHRAPPPLRLGRGLKPSPRPLRRLTEQMRLAEQMRRVDPWGQL